MDTTTPLSSPLVDEKDTPPNDAVGSYTYFDGLKQEDIGYNALNQLFAATINDKILPHIPYAEDEYYDAHLDLEMFFSDIFEDCTKNADSQRSSLPSRHTAAQFRAGTPSLVSIETTGENRTFRFGRPDLPSVSSRASSSSGRASPSLHADTEDGEEFDFDSADELDFSLPRSEGHAQFIPEGREEDLEYDRDRRGPPPNHTEHRGELCRLVGPRITSNTDEELLGGYRQQRSHRDTKDADASLLKRVHRQITEETIHHSGNDREDLFGNESLQLRKRVRGPFNRVAPLIYQDIGRENMQDAIEAKHNDRSAGYLHRPLVTSNEDVFTLNEIPAWNRKTIEARNDSVRYRTGPHNLAIEKSSYQHEASERLVSKARTVPANETDDRLKKQIAESQKRQRLLRPTKVSFECSCGRTITDDYYEVLDGGIETLRAELRKLSSYQTMTNSSHKPPAKSTGQRILSFFGIPAGRESQGNHLPQHNKPNQSTQDGEPEDKCVRATDSEKHTHDFVQLCVPRTRYATRMDALQSCYFSSDIEFFKALRKCYAKSKRNMGFYAWFRRPAALKFVKFRLYHHKLVDVLESDSIPPDNVEYDYNPMPAGTIPPIGPNLFLHFFNHPEEAIPHISLLKRIPRRKKDVLKPCVIEGTSVGWGIHIIHDLDEKRLIVLGQTGMLTSLLFGVAWTTVKNDIQGGFAVAAFMFTMIGFSLASLRLLDK